MTKPLKSRCKSKILLIVSGFLIAFGPSLLAQVADNNFDTSGYYTARESADCDGESCSLQFYAANTRTSFAYNTDETTTCTDGIERNICNTEQVNYDAIGGNPFPNALEQYRNPVLLFKASIVDGVFVVERALEKVGRSSVSSPSGDFVGLSKNEGRFEVRTLNGSKTLQVGIDDVNPYLVPRDGIYEILIQAALDQGDTIIIRGNDYEWKGEQRFTVQELYLPVAAITLIDPALCPAPYEYDGNSCTIYDPVIDHRCDFPLIPRIVGIDGTDGGTAKGCF